MSNPLFAPEVKLMLAGNDSREMRTFCETLHPATIAETLDDGFTPAQIWRVLKQTSPGDQAAIFEYLPIELQVDLAEDQEGKPELARLIEQMSSDDRAALLRRLAPRVRESLLRMVDEADRRDMARLAEYREDTVGAMMTTDYAWVPQTLTATEAIDRIRQLAPNSETIYYIYVLDEPTRKLLGVVSLRDLILTNRQKRVRDLMEQEVVTLKADEPRDGVGPILARYDFLALPVVDAEFRMLGIVTHDDVIDAVVEEATEDAHMMGAVGGLADDYLEAPFVQVWRTRAGWLACLFGAELFTFTALAHFEDEIGKLVVLSLFVPLCISTGGNSGSQAATLITRAMALGQLAPAQWRRVLRHELLMGMALGLSLGAIAFVRGVATPEDIRGGTKTAEQEFSIRVPHDRPLTMSDKRVVHVPPEASEMVQRNERDLTITLPDNRVMERVDRPGPDLEYRFPAKSLLREPPVNRWKLAQVISLAVLGICLWGTLVGSMLPLVFKRLGVDPGVASSPFVATFVDVTGILIYFSIAKLILLG